MERRLSVRVPSDESTALHVLKPLSTGRLAARVVDVSAGGMKLSVLEFLNPGSMVQIRLKDTIILGEVRYCVPTKDGFHVGVRQEGVGFPIPGTKSRKRLSK